MCELCGRTMTAGRSRFGSIEAAVAFLSHFSLRHGGSEVHSERECHRGAAEPGGVVR